MPAVCAALTPAATAVTAMQARCAAPEQELLCALSDQVVEGVLESMWIEVLWGMTSCTIQLTAWPCAAERVSGTGDFQYLTAYT